MSLKYEPSSEPLTFLCTGCSVAISGLGGDYSGQQEMQWALLGLVLLL